MATHYVSPRRACPALVGVDFVAGRAKLKQYNPTQAKRTMSNVH
jgi:hypothetical protein